MILVSLDCPFLITPLRFSLTIIYPLLVPTESKNVFVSEFVLPHTHTRTHIYIMENHNFNPPKKSSRGQFLSDFNNLVINESIFVIFCSYFQILFWNKGFKYSRFKQSIKVFRSLINVTSVFWIFKIQRDLHQPIIYIM